MSAKEQGPVHYHAWLRRTRRRLAASGGISQAAVRLAGENGGETGYWRQRLLALLDGTEPPTIDMITQIDSMLAIPAARICDDPAQDMLFPPAD